MGIYDFDYGTSPRKIEPEYRRVKRKKVDIQKQLKINEKQKREALKLEKRAHNKNILYVFAVFFILLAISYRSSLINEKFSQLQSSKNELAAIEKTNGQLEVSIETSLNLSNVENSAKEQLGMKKLDNSQKVYVTLDKKDYVESGIEDIKKESNLKWYENIIDKILGK